MSIVEWAESEEGKRTLRLLNLYADPLKTELREESNHTQEQGIAWSV